MMTEEAVCGNVGEYTMKKAILLAFLLCSNSIFAQSEAVDITLSPGDTIEIRFFYTPELNVIQTIRPDGKIVLQLVGEIVALGKTPNELNKELYTGFSKYLKQLDIAVFVQSYNNRYISVVGEVAIPGDIPMLRNLTTLEAIMLAGGVDTEDADYSNVVVMRHEGGKWIRYKVNLEDLLTGKSDAPFYLKPLDIVYVPSQFTFR